jgi:hypothetical protein
VSVLWRLRHNYRVASSTYVAIQPGCPQHSHETGVLPAAAASFYMFHVKQIRAMVATYRRNDRAGRGATPRSRLLHGIAA